MTSSFFMYYAEFLVSELFIHVSDSHQDHTEVSLIISCTRMSHSKVLNSFLQLLTLQSQVEFLLTINLRNYLDLKELKKKKTKSQVWVCESLLLPPYDVLTSEFETCIAKLSTKTINVEAKTGIVHWIFRL